LGGRVYRPGGGVKKSLMTGGGGVGDGGCGDGGCGEGGGGLGIGCGVMVAMVMSCLRPGTGEGLGRRVVMITTDWEEEGEGVVRGAGVVRGLGEGTGTGPGAAGGGE
jgi:hypothetical protein